MQSSNDNTPRLMSMTDVVKMTSLSRAQINKYRTLDRFPQAVSLGEKRIAFVRSEIEAWVRERIAARHQRDMVREARATWGPEAAHQLEARWSGCRLTHPLPSGRASTETHRASAGRPHNRHLSSG